MTAVTDSTPGAPIATASESRVHTAAGDDAAAAVDAAEAHPFVERVSEYARAVLRPTALATDEDGVEATRITELAGIGLLNHLAPRGRGGAELSRAADRRIHEILAGACLNTWLVWAQHAPLVGRLSALAQSGPLDPLIDDILRGRILVGAGLSDIRRYPDDYIRATPVTGGWRFSGTISWVSGWGLNTVLAVGAVDPHRGVVVTGLVDIDDSVRAQPLRLSALGGSRTFRVTLDGATVPEAKVISVEPLADWRRGDLGTAGDARPHHFGLAATILDELAADPHPLARQVAQRWRPVIANIRAHAYALSDDAADRGDSTHRIDERISWKVASGEALATISRALTVARAGRGLTHSDTAQLFARQASFLLVQGQRTDVRDAQLVELIAAAGRHPHD